MRVAVAWGPIGALALAAEFEVAVVVDVLTFSTTASVAADAGVCVWPYRWRDGTAATVAADHDAVLAVGRREASPGDVSLSPGSFRVGTPPARVVLPSPNGATICAVLAEAGAQVVVGSLRNRSAVAASLAARGEDVLVVAAGERWPDDSLRPAVEDWWGAGGVVAALLDRTTAQADDEALAAAAAYRLVEHRLGGALEACPSGRELIGWGFGSDVEIAGELDASARVPTLVGGWLQYSPSA